MTYPFWYLGEDEVLIFQMIGFVESLPAGGSQCGNQCT